MATHTAALPYTDQSVRTGWRALIAFVVVTAILLVLHGGRILEFAFTPMAVVLGIYLYRRNPKLYLLETLLVVCTAAFVRRAAESAAIREQSPILAATLILPFLSVLRSFRFNFLDKRHLCFTLALLGLAYAAAVGVLMNGTKSVLGPLATWLTPLVFGVFCFDLQSKDPETKRFFFQSCLAVGTFVALYGVLQYVSPLSSDTDWLAAMQANGMAVSMGSPVPYGIRVFSTLSNSQGAGALFGLCLLMASQLSSRWWKLPLMALFLYALTLTGVRSAWVAVAVVGIVLLVRAGPKARVQAIGALVLLVGVIAATASTDLGGSVIARLTTLQNVKNDTSYKERKQGRADAIKLTEQTFPFGAGLGWAGRYAKTLKFAPTDVGIAPIGIELGLLGCFLYGYGLLVVVIGPLRRGLFGRGINLALGAVLLYNILLLSDTNYLSTVMGIFFWGPAGLLLARDQHDPAKLAQHLPHLRQAPSTPSGSTRRPA